MRELQLVEINQQVLYSKGVSCCTALGLAFDERNKIYIFHTYAHAAVNLLRYMTSETNYVSDFVLAEKIVCEKLNENLIKHLILMEYKLFSQKSVNCFFYFSPCLTPRFCETYIYIFNFTHYSSLKPRKAKEKK